MIAVVFVVLAPCVAAGGVVDVAVATEGRATQRDVNDVAAIDTSVAQGGFVLRPSVTGALSNEGLVGSLSYAPALSMLAPLADPSQTLYSVMHTLDVRGEASLGDRTHVRSTVTGSLGELDPASAQSALQTSSGVLDPLVSIPYGAIAARLGFGVDFTRRLSLDANGSFDVSSSLGNDRIPLTLTPGVEVGGTWQATRADALSAGAHAQVSSVDGRGGFAGGGPFLGWRRQLGRSTGFALSGGVGAYSATDDESPPLSVVVLPRGSAEFSTVLGLAGESALEAGARVGVSAVNDPLGTLLENRAALTLDGGVRFTRDVALRGDLTAFAPAFAYAQRGPTSDATFAGRGLVAWTIGEHVAVESGVIVTTRVVEDNVATDAMLTIALTASAPVLHTGGRPTGSGHRRVAIGVSQVGDPPRPGATTVKEPPPLDIPDDLPPPPLVPPSGVLKPNTGAIDPNAPPVSGAMRPITEEEKKKAEEAKKKRREGEKPADAETTQNEDAAKKGEPAKEATPATP